MTAASGSRGWSPSHAERGRGVAASQPHRFPGRVADHPRDWKQRLERLSSLDWSRSNTKLWEGRAMTAGRLSKKSVNIALTASAIKRHLGIPLTEEEKTLEISLRGRRNGRAD
jgi:hypothetical protein